MRSRSPDRAGVAAIAVAEAVLVASLPFVPPVSKSGLAILGLCGLRAASIGFTPRRHLLRHAHVSALAGLFVLVALLALGGVGAIVALALWTPLVTAGVALLHLGARGREVNAPAKGDPTSARLLAAASLVCVLVSLPIAALTGVVARPAISAVRSAADGPTAAERAHREQEPIDVAPPPPSRIPTGSDGGFRLRLPRIPGPIVQYVLALAALVGLSLLLALSVRHPELWRGDYFPSHRVRRRNRRWRARRDPGVVGVAVAAHEPTPETRPVPADASRQSAVRHAYQLVISAAEEQGLEHRPQDTPAELARRLDVLTEQRLTGSIDVLTRAYEACRYGTATGDDPGALAAADDILRVSRR